MRTAPLTGNIGNMTGAYGSNALYHQAIAPGDWANGVSPQDTLPADWWNWLWCNITLQELNTVQDLNQIYGEIDNVLSAAAIEPMAECCDQLLAAIQVLTPPKDHSSQGNEYGGADTLNYGHVRITDDYNDANADSGMAASSIAVRSLYGIVQNIISTGGAPASDEPPVALGPVAEAGTCLETSRADHVHPYPKSLDFSDPVLLPWTVFKPDINPETGTEICTGPTSYFGPMKWVCTPVVTRTNCSSSFTCTFTNANTIDNNGYGIAGCTVCQGYNGASSSFTDYFSVCVCNSLADKNIRAIFWEHSCCRYTPQGGTGSCYCYCCIRNVTCCYVIAPGQKRGISTQRTSIISAGFCAWIDGANFQGVGYEGPVSSNLGTVCSTFANYPAINAYFC